MGSLDRRYKVIKRRGRGRFVIRYWDDDKANWREKTLDVKRRRDAEDAARVFLDSLDIEDPTTELTGTWASFRAKYEAEKGPALAGLSIWKSAAKKLEQCVRLENLADITPAKLSSFEAKMRADGLADATIETYLKYIRAALNWAADIELIAKAPRVRLPKGIARRARGRAVTGEEFDRWLLHLDVGDRFPSWERLMRGLYLSGLRLGESLNLWWDRDDRLMIVNLDGKRPLLQIPARRQKSRRETTCPLTPDLVAFLRNIPAKQRTGPVFCPEGKTRDARSPDYVGRTISAAGAAAKIIVARDGESISYATAHDLRRSFGDRWAQRVMPAVLKELMRHRSIETTMRYYVGRVAEQTADVVWQASKTWPGDTNGKMSPNPQKTSKP